MNAKEQNDIPPVEQCREKALRLLEMRPHTVREMSRKLFASRKYSSDEIHTVLNDLQKYGLLDDAAFARMFCEMMKNGPRPVGKRLVLRKLMMRGIPAEQASEIIAEIWGPDDDSEIEKALAAAEAKLTQIKRLTDDRQKQYRRLASFLIARGFGTDVVSSVMRRMM